MNHGCKVGCAHGRLHCKAKHRGERGFSVSKTAESRCNIPVKYKKYFLLERKAQEVMREGQNKNFIRAPLCYLPLLLSKRKEVANKTSPGSFSQRGMEPCEFLSSVEGGAGSCGDNNNFSRAPSSGVPQYL